MSRRPRPLKRAAELEDRLWLELDRVIPPGVRTHLRQARREMLLAVRDLLDYLIARSEASETPRRPRRVRVR